ncbi:MAG: phosphatidylinositol-specific phospholipase C1-like protein [Actinomycetota bacterium]|nr:phosphatidylinositol-specific phospholipase C1-like protein [Actinomycetota bacterium]
MRRTLALAAVIALSFAAPASAASVRLNHLQTVGSHNSYHLEVSEREKQIRSEASGDQEASLEYAYPPLGVQFADQDVRQIELDLLPDDTGGRFVAPAVRIAAGLGPLQDPAMYRSGIKVLHIQDADYVTTCSTLVACLSEVKAQSDRAGDHVPFTFLLELKDDPIGNAATWTPARIAAAEAEIASVFPRDRILTPDDVRGSRATLNEAVVAKSWPTIDRARGKVLFLLDNEPGTGAAVAYRTLHPGARGSLVFPNSTPGTPEAAFVKLNDAKNDQAQIRRLVKTGYVVRTRADANTTEARANDTSTRDAALASGAQWVSTDYPAPGYADRFASPYFVSLGKPARCNPIVAPRGCRDAVFGR